VTKAAIRRQLQILRESLTPPGSRLVAATRDVRTGQLQRVLKADGSKEPATTGLAAEDLPAGCVVYDTDRRAEAALMYLGTDGRLHLQVVHGVCLDVIVGRRSWDAFPMQEWPKIFARQRDAGLEDLS
jgi:hypothetical protein